MPAYTLAESLHQLAPHILADLQPSQALKQFTLTQMSSALTSRLEYENLFADTWHPSEFRPGR